EADGRHARGHRDGNLRGLPRVLLCGAWGGGAGVVTLQAPLRGKTARPARHWRGPGRGAGDWGEGKGEASCARKPGGSALTLIRPFGAPSPTGEKGGCLAIGPARPYGILPRLNPFRGAGSGGR